VGEGFLEIFITFREMENNRVIGQYFKKREMGFRKNSMKRKLKLISVDIQVFTAVDRQLCQFFHILFWLHIIITCLK
jgi:hypothetical protein